MGPWYGNCIKDAKENRFVLRSHEAHLEALSELCSRQRKKRQEASSSSSIQQENPGMYDTQVDAQTEKEIMDFNVNCEVSYGKKDQDDTCPPGNK